MKSRIVIDLEMHEAPLVEALESLPAFLETLQSFGEQLTAAGGQCAVFAARWKREIQPRLEEWGKP